MNGLLKVIQSDQINMAVLFWYLVKSDASYLIFWGGEYPIFVGISLDCLRMFNMKRCVQDDMLGATERYRLEYRTMTTYTRNNPKLF